MSLSVFSVVFAVALFSGLAVMGHLTRKTVVEEPPKEAPARRSAVAEFTDDLLKHRWKVIIVLALLVALDKFLRFSGGLLESRLVMTSAIAIFFIVRLLLRQRAQPAQENADSKRHEST